MNSKAFLDLAQQINILKSIERQGWLLKEIRNVESVSDHVFQVAFLTMILSKGRKLDHEKMLKMALVHDVGEIIVGDVIYERGGKLIGPLEIKHEDERKAIRKIFINMENRSYYISLWEEWVAQKTKESKFVKCVEKLELVFQALEYEKQKYKTQLFDEYWENAEKYLIGTEFESLFRELQKRRKKLK